MVGIFETGDTADVMEVVSDGYLDHQGQGGVAVHGASGLVEVVRANCGAFASLNLEVEDIFAEADRAVARIRWRGPLAATREWVDREIIDIIRVADGRVVEHWGAETWSRREPPPE